MRALALALVLMTAVIHRAAAAGADGSALIPVYDPIDDVGALMTPTVAVEMVRHDETCRGELTFSAVHPGRDLQSGLPSRILLRLSTEAPCFGTRDRLRIILLADDARLELEVVVHTDDPTLPSRVRELLVWLDRSQLAILARAREAAARAGHCDFPIPADLLGHLRDLERRLGAAPRGDAPEAGR